MIIFGKKELNKFAKKHANSRSAIKAWIETVEKANWENTSDIKKAYSTASFLSENKVIFNIKGNDYRLVTVIVFIKKYIYIKWIGTHAEYNKKTF